MFGISPAGVDGCPSVESVGEGDGEEPAVLF